MAGTGLILHVGSVAGTADAARDRAGRPRIQKKTA